MITGLFHLHKTLGWVLLGSTSVSVLLAIIGLLIGAKPGLVKAAAVLSRGLETSLVGLMLLLGIGLWMGRFPVSIGYGWIGLVGVVVQMALLAKGIKPNLISLRDGAGSRGRWLGLAAAHWALVLFVFTAMTARW